MNPTHFRTFKIPKLMVMAMMSMNCAQSGTDGSTWDPSSSSSGSIPTPRMNGPGRVSAMRKTIEGAHRVRSPAMKHNARTSSSITQPLNGEDGGRPLTIDLTGLSADVLFFGLGPLVQARTSQNDAGEDVTEEVLTDPPVVKRIENNAAEDLIAFTNPEDQDCFATTNRFTVNIEGEDYIEQRNLLLQTESDPLGNVYLASNVCLKVWKISPGGIAEIFAVLDSPPSDIKYRDGFLIMTLLPRLSDDLIELISPPRVVEYDESGVFVATLTELPAERERYTANSKRFTDADGGSFRSPFAIIFALTFHTSGKKFITSSYEGVIYSLDTDGGLAQFTSGLHGISSITDSPATDSLYIILPAEFQTNEDVDAGTVTTSYLEYPRLMGMNLDGGIVKLADFMDYATVPVERAKNGFTLRVEDGREIGTSMVQTIAADEVGNLVFGDPVLNEITFIQVIEGADAGP